MTYPKNIVGSKLYHVHATLGVSEECNCSYVFEIPPSKHSQDYQRDHSHVWDDF